MLFKLLKFTSGRKGQGWGSCKEKLFRIFYKLKLQSRSGMVVFIHFRFMKRGWKTEIMHTHICFVLLFSLLKGLFLRKNG